MSLKLKIGSYLLIFGLGMISLLVVFQMFLLEPMYESNKIRFVKEISDSVLKYMKTDELDDVIESQQVRTDACIAVYRPSEGSYEEARFSNCMHYRLSALEILENTAKASKSSDGTYLYVGEREMKGESRNRLKVVVYTRIVAEEDDDDGNAVIMVNSTISPIDAAVKTLQSQLLYFGAIVVIGVIVLTYLMNWRIAEPLMHINESAKKLSEGEYENNPSTNRYLEAQELNETLSRAAVDIRKADQAKRDLIANVSHDLRTPLTMITGYGEMMLDLPEEKTDENVQVIIDESKRLNTLVNDLLDLSRLQEGKITISSESFDLASLIRSEMRKYDVYRMKDGFRIEEYICENAEVTGDQKRLAQVFNNFMTNAINYCGEAKHIIVRTETDKGRVKVSVQDFGPGIAEKDLKNIWDRYYKVDREHVRVSSGSGIGLAIAKEILDLHHCGYGVESKVDQGSTFWFSLPLQERERV
ncbi:MAG: HAMP domain-containing histidine kinase [Solobacterium sp.]|nr:HAMP domain-containing histidine kinase [Solobacterium sp.]